MRRANQVCPGAEFHSLDLLQWVSDVDRRAAIRVCDSAMSKAGGLHKQSLGLVLIERLCDLGHAA